MVEPYRASLSTANATGIDEAILGVYLSGGNTRRVRGALAPLLKGGPLSKDAVSRLVAGSVKISTRGGSGI